jgi:GAF domain-containing protein
VPIRNKKREVIGVTQVLNKLSGDFDSEDQRLLEGLSLQASAALENARLFEKVERQQREEAMLLEVSISIVSEIHLDPLLEKIMAAATTLLGADRGTLFLYDAPATNCIPAWPAASPPKASAFPPTPAGRRMLFSTAKVINLPTPTPTRASTRRSTATPATAPTACCACPSSPAANARSA